MRQVFIQFAERKIHERDIKTDIRFRWDAPLAAVCQISPARLNSLKYISSRESKPRVSLRSLSLAQSCSLHAKVGIWNGWALAGGDFHCKFSQKLLKVVGTRAGCCSATRKLLHTTAPWCRRRMAVWPLGSHFADSRASWSAQSDP